MPYLCRFPVFLMAALVIVLALPSYAQTAAQQSKDEYYRMVLEKAKERMDQMQRGGMDHDMMMGAQSPESYGAGHDRIARAEIIKAEPLEQGQDNEVTIRLTYEDDDSPVPIENLQVIHTEPLHLLVIEPQLDDYHHIHPQPTDIAGEYKFTINPETDCHYRAWADIYPVDGPEQNTWVDLEGARLCDDKAIQETKNMTASHNGYQYMISLSDEELAYDQDTLLSVDVMDEDGKAVTDLQPVMGTFAHLVGFFKDYETIAHIHPMGDEITDPEARGGPSLKFHVKPEKAGYVRFYLQALIDDEMQFVPFGVVIAEEGPYSGQDRMMEIMMMGDSRMMNHAGMGSTMGEEDHPPMQMPGQTGNVNQGLSDAQKEQFKKLLEENNVTAPKALLDLLE